MQTSRQRKKLVNASVYFARTTEKFGLVKLFKLLYFLDFEHYKEIGRSVTGLDYKAWKQGPVPEDLYYEIKRGVEADLAEGLIIDPRAFRDNRKFYKITAKGYEDNSAFSPSEEAIMKQLAEDFKYADAEQMTEVTHLPNTPWDRVFNQEKREGEEIPYEYGVPDEDKELIAYIRSENTGTELNNKN